MPVFVENPAQFSKRRLKSELISRSVALPPAESEKRVYLEAYMKRVGNKQSADFSSDEEELFQTGHEEKEARREHSDMVDLSSLTDDQLRCKLLQYGVKAGPIVASTRVLYERRLHRLMAQHSRHSVNNKHDPGKYSDSDEEEEEEEETSSATSSMIENRLSPQPKSAETARSHSYTPVASRPQRQLNKSSMNASLYQTPEFSPLQKQSTTIKPAIEAVTDVLKEMFPDTALTPTGIRRNGSVSSGTLKGMDTTKKPGEIREELFPNATKRRSIKGAAGRPVQYKYPETPLSPSTLERLEIQQRLVPLWVQIAVFILAVAVLYLIYISMEEPLETPFSTFVNTPGQELNSDDLALVPDSEGIHT